MRVPSHTNYLANAGCTPPAQAVSADAILTAIQNADEATKQRLKDELAKCKCWDVKDIFGDPVNP